MSDVSITDLIVRQREADARIVEQFMSSYNRRGATHAVLGRVLDAVRSGALESVTAPTKPPVHNHGPAEGRGLDCNESIVGGFLQGACMRVTEQTDPFSQSPHMASKYWAELVKARKRITELEAAVTAPTEPRKFTPEQRADLVDAATSRIQDTWNDVGATTADVLAGNVVVAQEFIWLSMHFPVTVPTEATGGAQLISAERTRQIEDEGYSAQEDAGKAHALVDAAVAYAHVGRTSKGKVPLSWPWADRFWKPSDDPVRNLTKAGALIAAAIDSIRSAEVSS